MMTSKRIKEYGPVSGSSLNYLAHETVEIGGKKSAKCFNIDAQIIDFCNADLQITEKLTLAAHKIIVDNTLLPHAREIDILCSFIEFKNMTPEAIKVWQKHCKFYQ